MSSGSIVAALAATLVLASCQHYEKQEDGSAQPGQPASQSAAPASAPAQSPVERGRYLVTIAGCHDCHTPMKMGAMGPEPDFSQMLSGHPESVVLPPPPKLPPGPWMITAFPLTAWSGPWGITYATNLTPDSLSGLGIWTEEMFIGALRTGKHMGTSRPILPPMPWQFFVTMPNEDLSAIYAFLRSIPPIRNTIPDPVIAEPPKE